MNRAIEIVNGQVRAMLMCGALMLFMGVVFGAAILVLDDSRLALPCFAFLLLTLPFLIRAAELVQNFMQESLFKYRAAVQKCNMIENRQIEMLSDLSNLAGKHEESESRTQTRVARDRSGKSIDEDLFQSGSRRNGNSLASTPITFESPPSLHAVEPYMKVMENRINLDFELGSAEREMNLAWQVYSTAREIMPLKLFVSQARFPAIEYSALLQSQTIRNGEDFETIAEPFTNGSARIRFASDF